MHALWRSIRTVRLVLVAYGLVVAMGLVSPVLSDVGVQVVCVGGGGIKTIVVGDDGKAQSMTSASMECPLCQTVAPPPMFAALPAAAVSPLAHAATPVAVARLHALTGAPLPARGPPLS